MKVPLSSIEWIEADHSHVLLQCGSRVYRKSASLKQMTEDLAGAGFMRIHLSTLVNTRAIDRVEHGLGVTAVRVRSGERLRVSRPYRPDAQALKKLSRSRMDPETVESQPSHRPRPSSFAAHIPCGKPLDQRTRCLNAPRMRVSCSIE